MWFESQFGAKNLVDPNAPRETDVTANSTAVVCLMFDAAAFGEHFEAVKHSLARVLAGRRWELENRGKVMRPRHSRRALAPNSRRSDVSPPPREHGPWRRYQWTIWRRSACSARAHAGV